MIINNFNTDEKLLVIAEIGNNHEGNFALAEKMIILAAEAGVGAVKFQTFKTEHFVSSTNLERFEKLKSFELDFNEFEKLALIAEKQGLIFLSTPLDIESAIFLNQLVPAFKIASGDNNFYPLIETVAKTGKPVLLSTGLADFNQISYTKSFIEQTWNERSTNNKQEVAILHCVTSYPVPADEANLLAIPLIKEKFQCMVGYSDHTMGVEAAALSVAMGAEIIEKHFTIDKDYSDFRDHQLSADPNEMKQLVKRINSIVELMGKKEKKIQTCEQVLEEAVRRSIVASRDLTSGTILHWEDITWVRPGNGIKPGQEHLILGKKIKKSICAGEQIKSEDVTI